MLLKPEILIISSLHDYATDHVVYQLEKQNAKYLRLNRDQFNEYQLSFEPINNKIYGKNKIKEFEIDELHLNSIYYRAPIYLRPYQRKSLSLEEKLSREQWISFLRGLMTFDNINWVNYPQSTFLSESKPYQLKIASNIGFKVPKTLITNKIPPKNIYGETVAIKTLEPAIFNIENKESFIYTNILKFNELKKYDLSTTPIILQEAIVPKIDIRVTVINNDVYPVSIKHENAGIDGDWRRRKEDIDYELIELPKNIEEKCINLLKKLDLKFGCIDLIKHKEDYYFIEINPTGEWDWLMYNLNIDIDKKIANLLTK